MTALAAMGRKYETELMMNYSEAVILEGDDPLDYADLEESALQPGETRTVELTLDMRALAYFDDACAAWVADAGTFEVLVGSSSRDIRGRAPFSLSGDWISAVREAQTPPEPLHRH